MDWSGWRSKTGRDAVWSWFPDSLRTLPVGDIGEHGRTLGSRLERMGLHPLGLMVLGLHPLVVLGPLGLQVHRPERLVLLEVQRLMEPGLDLRRRGLVALPRLTRHSACTGYTRNTPTRFQTAVLSTTRLSR